MLAFWGGLSMLESSSQWSKFLYCCINLVMIAVGAALQRRVFVVFGGLGLVGYLSYLAYRVFADNVLFPVWLTVLGIAVVYAGILWQRHEAMLGTSLRSVRPTALQTMLVQVV